MRILSLSRDSVPCEFATRLAVDAGFAVVKAEDAAGDPLGARAPGLYAFLSAGKERVGVDAASLRQALAGCDAVVVDEWGRDLLSGLAQGNGPALLDLPPLIVVGERDSDALAAVPAGRCDEFLAFHSGGLGFLTPRVMPGYPSAGPLCPNAHLIEFMTGLYGAIALFAALAGARDGGAKSQAPISVGLTAAALPLLRREIASVLYDNNDPHRSERIWKVSPAEIHRTRDGWVFVNAIEDEQWQRLCKYMDRLDLTQDPAYATRELRFQHADAIGVALDAFFGPRSKSVWREAQAAGVPVAPVNAIADLIRDPQLEARGFWTHLDAKGGALRVPSTPLARQFGVGAARLDAQAKTGTPAAAAKSDPKGNAPLSGIRVLELTHVWSGPFAGQILADLGAEVIRIESRAHLDIHRRGGPYAGGKAGINRSGTWNAQNRGKYGCTLDIKSAEGRELFLQLVRESDVVIENFAPGTLERRGLGFDVLKAANPRIVLARLSGYGQSGPYRDSLAYGPMMDAATGLSAATAYADGLPRAVNGWAADIGGALFGCAGVVRALLDPRRTAVEIDVSQFEAGVLFTAESLLREANPGTQASESGLRAVAETRDADHWVAVSARAADIPALVKLVGSGSVDNASRTHLEKAFCVWAAARGRQEALAALAAAGIPAAPVSTTRELLGDARLRERGAWLEVNHPEAGLMTCYGPPIHLGGVEAAASRRPAPMLGEHNDYVYGTLLKLPAEKIRDLAGRSVI